MNFIHHESLTDASTAESSTPTRILRFTRAKESGDATLVFSDLICGRRLFTRSRRLRTREHELCCGPVPLWTAYRSHVASLITLTNLIILVNALSSTPLPPFSHSLSPIGTFSRPALFIFISLILLLLLSLLLLLPPPPPPTSPPLSFALPFLSGAARMT